MKDASHLGSPKLQFPTGSFQQQHDHSAFAHEVGH